MNKSKQRKIKTSDGTIIHIWDNKMHNWEGPAFIPQGDNKKAEYYIYGMKHSKDEWQEARKSQTGLPYYKQSGFKDTRF
jgi:hypothetical protein